MVKDGNERVTVTLPVSIVAVIEKMSEELGYSKSIIVRALIETGLCDEK